MCCVHALSLIPAFSGFLRSYQGQFKMISHPICNSDTLSLWLVLRRWGLATLTRSYGDEKTRTHTQTHTKKRRKYEVNDTFNTFTTCYVCFHPSPTSSQTNYSGQRTEQLQLSHAQGSPAPVRGPCDCRDGLVAYKTTARLLNVPAWHTQKPIWVFCCFLFLNKPDCQFGLYKQLSWLKDGNYYSYPTINHPHS